MSDGSRGIRSSGDRRVARERCEWTRKGKKGREIACAGSVSGRRDQGRALQTDRDDFGGVVTKVAPTSEPRRAGRRPCPTFGSVLPSGDFDHVVRGGFFLAGGAHADVAGFFAERGERCGSEVAHAALDAADEVVDCVVERAADFFEGFDAFGGGFAGGVVFVVAVARGAAGFHRGETAHAAVLFIEFAADLHDLAGRFAATGQDAAADDGVGEGEGFDDVAGFGDAAVGEEFDVLLFGGRASNVEGGELGDADAGDDAGGADGAGALADLDGIGTAVGEEGDAGGAGDVAGDDGEIGEGGADEFDHVADPGGVAVGGGDGDGVDGFFDEGADVGEDFFTVERAAREAHGGEGGADDEAKAGVAGGLAAGFGLGGDALDVGSGDEALEAVVGADDEHFVDADVGGKEAVGGGDGVFGGGGDGFRDKGGAGRHHFGDAFGAVAVLDDVAGEQAGEAAGGVNDGKR